MNAVTRFVSSKTRFGAGLGLTAPDGVLVVLGCGGLGSDLRLWGYGCRV